MKITKKLAETIVNRFSDPIEIVRMIRSNEIKVQVVTSTVERLVYGESENLIGDYLFTGNSEEAKTVIKILKEVKENQSTFFNKEEHEEPKKKEKAT